MSQSSLASLESFMQDFLDDEIVESPIRELIQFPVSDVPHQSNLRKHLLVTLSHVERQAPNLNLTEVFSQLQQCCTVIRAVGCKEKHEEGGFHYHMAVENSNASKNTITKRIRAAFPEFDGRQVDVKFHKSWVKMLQYVTKEDEDFQCFSADDDYTRDMVLQELECKQSKTLNAVYAIRKHIDNGGSIQSMVRDDLVAPFMLRSAASVTQFATYVQQSAPRETFLQAVDRVGSTGSIHNAERFLNDHQKTSLREFVQQMQGRKPRQPQLYCVGDSCTGKTYPFMLLSQHLPGCFIPCLENNDRAFANYNDDEHDWILINDFHDNIKFQLLSNLCEGSWMTLNGYGTQKQKKKNVPIVFTANQLPSYKNLDNKRVDALKKRLIPITFTTSVEEYQDDLSVEDLCALLITYQAGSPNQNCSQKRKRSGTEDPSTPIGRPRVRCRLDFQ